MSVVAKFKVSQITNFPVHGPDGALVLAREVRLVPVGPNDSAIYGPREENAIFGTATPSGEIRMQILNDDAGREFERAMGGGVRVTFQIARDRTDIGGAGDEDDSRC